MYICYTFGLWDFEKLLGLIIQKQYDTELATMPRKGTSLACRLQDESACPKKYPCAVAPVTCTTSNINSDFWGGKWPHSCRHCSTYSCQVWWKLVKQKWPKQCKVYLTGKKVSILHLFWGPWSWSDSAKNFAGSLFPSVCHVLSKSNQCLKRYMQKCRLESSEYRCEAYRLHAVNDGSKQLQSTGYSALHSPPRVMRHAVAAQRTHTQTDAERHNTFSAR